MVTVRRLETQRWEITLRTIASAIGLGVADGDGAWDGVATGALAEAEGAGDSLSEASSLSLFSGAVVSAGDGSGAEDVDSGTGDSSRSSDGAVMQPLNMSTAEAAASVNTADFWRVGRFIL
jgi:hypothetical protein